MSAQELAALLILGKFWLDAFLRLRLASVIKRVRLFQTGVYTEFIFLSVYGTLGLEETNTSGKPKVLGSILT